MLFIILLLIFRPLFCLFPISFKFKFVLFPKGKIEEELTMIPKGFKEFPIKL